MSLIAAVPCRQAIVSEPQMCTDRDRERLAEIMFEGFGSFLCPASARFWVYSRFLVVSTCMALSLSALPRSWDAPYELSAEGVSWGAGAPSLLVKPQPMLAMYSYGATTGVIGPCWCAGQGVSERCGLTPKWRCSGHWRSARHCASGRGLHLRQRGHAPSCR